MIRKTLAIALGIALPVLGALALIAGIFSSESLYPSVLRLCGPSVRSDREGASPVVLVEIDNAAQDAQGPWPWPSARLDALLLAVASGGARAVVVDQSLFTDPAHSPTAGLWSSLPGGVPFVLPSRQATREPSGCQVWKIPAGLPEADFRRIEPQDLPAGVPCDERFNVGLDTLVPSGGSLTYPLVWTDGKHLVPSLPVVALLVSAPNSVVGTWWNAEQTKISTAQGQAKLDGKGGVLLRPLGAPGQGIPRVNAATVLAQKVTPDLFRGRVVIVGVTATGLVPACSVPFTAALAGDRMPRAEATATMLMGMMEQSLVVQPAWGDAVPWGLMLVAGLLAWVGLRQPRRRWTLLVQIVFGCVLVVAWWVLFRLNLWITPWAFGLPLAGSFAVVLLWPKPVKRVPIRNYPSHGLPPRPQRHVETARNPTASVHGSSVEIPVAQGAGENHIQRGPDGDVVRLGRYIDFRPIGTGGMCKVYAAHDPVMERQVAIKILRTDKAKGQTTEQRFLREARIAGSLHHPNINTVYDFGQADDILYLVLEFVEGETLSQWVKEHNGVRPKAILPWVRQIGEALDAAHSAQVVHRDVKPSNFMIVRSTGAIKLMDFGVARTPDVTLTQAGTTVGTPNYMSPEQLQGSKVGSSSDLYSFGVVVYQILSQRLPFHGEGLTALCNAILKGNCTRLSTHRPDLAGPVEQVVHKAFSVRAEDRFASGAEFVEAFEKAVSH